MSDSLRHQLYGVKKALKQARKVRIALPNEFTFNRGGTKYFDGVLSCLDWTFTNRPVEIDFTTCDSANYQALSLLIPYLHRLKQQGCAVTVTLDKNDRMDASRVWAMMGAHGLFAVSTDPTTNFKFNEHKPLFAIRNSDDFKAALSCADAMTQEFGVDYKETLRYITSELLYNTMEHGKSDFFWRGRRYPTPSILQFSWYEKINELHFIVIDTGIGVRRHLAQAYPNIASDEEALQLAVQPEISGTFGQHDPYANRNNAGMGLYLSSNIVRRLHADLYLVSGHGLLHVSPVDTTSHELSSEWPGTFVLLTIRVDRGSAIALDAITQQLREQARLEVESRREGEKQNRFYLSMFNYFGKYADDKGAAIKYRDRHLIPAVDQGKTLLLDFQDVESSTHSFLNALLASPIRRLGMMAFKRVKVVNATPNIRETIDYVLDDNTGQDDSVGPKQ
jgi:hypothetical protein